MIEIRTETVAEFMRALLVTEPHFGPLTWYFRGQSDAQWGLIPSLFRRRSWDDFGGVDALGLECNGDYLVSPQAVLPFQEASIFKMLANIVDSMGLPPHLKLGEEREAFAQHIGLPTRLLDWTRSPWTAAYFAAAGAAPRFKEDGKLAVFAVSTFFLTNSTTMTGVEKITVGAAGNPNLVAQQGILVRVLGNRIDLLDGQAIIEPSMDSPGNDRRFDRQLLKLTLPWRRALELLRTLRDQEVHAATIYPGQVGVAKLVRELFLSGANPSD